MESLREYDTLIYNEMMSHVPLFSHPNPQKIAIFHHDEHGIKQQIMNHPTVTEVLEPSDLMSLPLNSLDILIIGNHPELISFQHYFQLLKSNGILLQKSAAPFEIIELKKIQVQLRSAGFEDTQPLLFPQPTTTPGWRSAIMAIKQGVLKRIREKDIFNKPFATHYYNYDMHNAALALPEFMRTELVS